MTTPEGKVKTKLDRMLKEEDIWFFPPQAGPYGRAGVPDRVCCINGMFVGIEAKADASKEPTALQMRAAAGILAAGGKWFLVYDNRSIEDLRYVIRGLKLNAGSTRKEVAANEDQRSEHYTISDSESESPKRMPRGGSAWRGRNKRST